MTTFERFERDIPELMNELTPVRVPDYFDSMLQETARHRQRPAWSYLERWLPMGVIARTVPMRPLSWRPILILALIGALIAAGLALYVGSHQQRLPPPYGPSANGVSLYSTNGEIYSIDQVTHRDAVLVSGPEWDSDPDFSGDGTKFAFLRRTSESSASAVVVVANSDGSDLRVVTQPLVDVSSGDWSGDASYIALTSAIGEVQSLTVVDVRSGTSKVLDLGMSVASVSWLPPDGREIVFRGVTPLLSAVWAVRPDGSGLRALTSKDGVPDFGYQEPVVSPDGRLLAYDSWDDVVHLVMHVRDLSTGSSRVIPAAEQFDDRMTAEFSPDGRQLLHVRSLRDGPPPDFSGVLQLVLAPVDGSSSGIPLGPTFPYPAKADVPDLGFTFAPDGSFVVLHKAGEPDAWSLPVDGRPGTKMGLRGGDRPEIQRVAP